MSDKELIRTLAEKVMGWPVRVHGDMDQRGYAKPEPDGTLVLWDDLNEIHMCRHWQPLTSDSDAFMVVDALVAKGYDVILGCMEHNSCVEIRRWRDRRAEGIPGDPFTGRSRETLICETAETRRRAICQAAVRV